MTGTTPVWLIDKSAYVRLGSGRDDQVWADRIDRGLVRMATLTRLELGYSARTAAGWQAELEAIPLAAMPIQYLTPAIEDRAVEVQLLLADRGPHRAPSIPDLLVAATAELAGLLVLHVDKDFDLIAMATGQPVERMATDEGT
ncbi:MAG: PIN domain nuclease [Acidimicrobiales bacterium]